jgi:hypothetical protein
MTSYKFGSKYYMSAKYEANVIRKNIRALCGKGARDGTIHDPKIKMKPHGKFRSHLELSGSWYGVREAVLKVKTCRGNRSSNF